MEAAAFWGGRKAISEVQVVQDTTRKDEEGRPLVGRVWLGVQSEEGGVSDTRVKARECN